MTSAKLNAPRWLTLAQQALDTCSDCSRWTPEQNEMTRDRLLNFIGLLANGEQLTVDQSRNLRKQIEVRLSRDTPDTGLIRLTKGQLDVARKKYPDMVQASPSKEPARFVLSSEYDSQYALIIELLDAQTNQIGVLKAAVAGLKQELAASRGDSCPITDQVLHGSCSVPAAVLPDSCNRPQLSPGETNVTGDLDFNSCSLREDKRRELNGRPASQAQLAVGLVSQEPVPPSFLSTLEEHLEKPSRAAVPAAILTTQFSDEARAARSNRVLTKARHSVVLYQGKGRTYGQAMVDGVNYRVQFKSFDSAANAIWANAPDPSWVNDMKHGEGAYASELGHPHGASALYAKDDKYADHPPIVFNAILLAFWHDESLVEVRLVHAEEVSEFARVKGPSDSLFKGLIK